MPSRLVLSGIAVLVIAGCGPNAPEHAKSAGPVSPSVAAGDNGGAEALDRGQILAEKSTSYIPQMPQPSPKSLHQAQASADPIPAAPREVPMPRLEWLSKPWDLRLGDPQETTPPMTAERKEEAPAAASTPASPSPAINSTASDHQIAAVDLSRTDVQPVTIKPEAKPAPDPLEMRLVQAARDFPRDLEPQLEQQLLQFLQGKNVPQMDAVAGLPADERELLSAVLDGLTNLRAAGRDSSLPFAKRVRPMLDAADRLRAQAGLTIPTIALCSRVEGFGVYDPITSTRFTAGREHAVVVYCEVENFASRANDKGIWETALAQEVVIYDDASVKVASEKQQAVTDLSRNRRHDFFVGRRVKLPASLAPGNYTVRVTIRDQQANRLAEATTGIQIVADK